MPTPTFFWHDYETSGADAMRDRPLQFAGIRTDMNLEPVGEPVMHYCRPARDTLPHPQATLITGITPQQAQRDGVIEAEFAGLVHEQLAMPGTCGVGYNTLRFDDTITRTLLYRNFFDPYAREWRDGNSRWDIIDLARMCHALRPDGIVWPERDDGSPSFRLEHLATANHLDQKHAHDALSDVEATIALARLLKSRQPKLWAWYFGLRAKRSAASLLDLTGGTPLLHVSSRYPASRACLSMVLPLAMHPSRSTEVIVANLDSDVQALIDLDAESIADRLFTPRDDLPEGVERVGLRTIHTNRSPALAPLSVLKHTAMDRLPLDVDACLANADRLRIANDLPSKVRQVYAAAGDLPSADDVDIAIYGGFLPDRDRPLLDAVRGTPPAGLATGDFPFTDSRYPELLFRYRARNWPDTLDQADHERWHALRRERIEGHSPAVALNREQFDAILADLRADPARSAGERALLDQLEAWGLELTASLAD